ncbi:hypothetical protein [Epilithonimonas hominis]|uniref:hypothetical protein n=1 Tax=Epilithonimonas hominis TaxID=420404 RepID=UPI00289B82CC|nr:hypothetical protein [Epilithonimonas hominis]
MIQSKPQVRQQWILEKLMVEPTVTFLNLFREYEVKFSKTEQTFSKDWKIAKEQHSEYQKTIIEKKMDAITDLELKATEQGILDKLGNMKILSEIIQDTGEQTADRIRAVDVLNRMQGNYSIDNEQSSAKTIVWNEIKNYKTD